MKTDVAVIEISDEEMKKFGYEGEIKEEDRLEYLQHILEEEENTIDWSGYDLKITETRR
jgi:hypothetical protein